MDQFEVETSAVWRSKSLNMLAAIVEPDGAGTKRDRHGRAANGPTRTNQETYGGGQEWRSGAVPNEGPEESSRGHMVTERKVSQGVEQEQGRKSAKRLPCQALESNHPAEPRL